VVPRYRDQDDTYKGRPDEVGRSDVNLRGCRGDSLGQ